MAEQHEELKEVLEPTGVSSREDPGARNRRLHAGKTWWSVGPSRQHRARVALKNLEAPQVARVLKPLGPPSQNEIWKPGWNPRGVQGPEIYGECSLRKRLTYLGTFPPSNP